MATQIDIGMSAADRANIAENLSRVPVDRAIKVVPDPDRSAEVA